MFKKSLLYINIIFALLLVSSGFAKYINPVDFWIPAFIGIAYPFLLIINIFFFFFWLFLSSKKKKIFFSGIAIVLTWSNFSSIINISAPARTLNEISILTWNVKNFDLYNWSNNKETRKLMMNFIEEKNPDILCLQEFYTEKSGEFKNIKEIKKRLGYKYYYFGETFNIRNKKRWGLITFSKFPIKNSGQIKFSKASKLNSCIYTDIEFSKDSIYRVYNIHLQSLHFGDDDYDYLKELKNEHKPDIKSTLQILRKMKRAFVKRSKQAQLIKTHIKNQDKKTIICGDFNDTPSSFAYHLLSENKQDAFKMKGLGFGKTLVNPTPFFRIDYLLFNKQFSIKNYKKYKVKYTDHYPVFVHFEK